MHRVSSMGLVKEPQVHVEQVPYYISTNTITSYENMEWEYKQIKKLNLVPMDSSQVFIIKRYNRASNTW